MGFLDKALGAFGGGEEPSNCPDCGGALERFADGSAWCDGCGTGFVDGEDHLLNRDSPRADPSHGTHGRICEACQNSLNDGDHYLPYEDGSNSHAYIRCRCGHENILYGFGEDD